MPKRTIQEERRLAVRLEAKLHQQAHDKAAQQGMKLSDVIRALLIWWIKSGKDVKDLEK